ncbi:MAG TPA: LysM peptidoglycan-binding domain-containing protein [Mycobacteriales bacterium]|nr:LysM peptidoglycan-binding domain-containing protein [Mycobacteriales bacterium]
MTTTRATRSSLRLTRRGRVVAVLVVMLSTVVGGFGLGRSTSLAAGRAHAPVRHTVVVEPGETLWAVALRVAPHEDPRLAVADLERANHLASAEVAPGQELVVPAGG